MATILLVTVLAPSFGPMALAYAAQTGTMHCVRKPMQVPEAAPGMPCHHASPGMMRLRASEANFGALDSCCANHDCCRGLKTSERARPLIGPLLRHGLTAEAASRIRFTVDISADLNRPGFARAPPQK